MKKITMKKIITLCRKCASRFLCSKKGLRPPIGVCSISNGEDRERILQTIKKKIDREMVIFLKRPVTVIRDYLGMELTFNVRKISSLPPKEVTMEFSLGKDEYGETVTTGEITTKDLKKILKQL